MPFVAQSENDQFEGLYREVGQPVGTVETLLLKWRRGATRSIFFYARAHANHNPTQLALSLEMASFKSLGWNDLSVYSKVR